jgi:hypothetical protein
MLRGRLPEHQERNNRLSTGKVRADGERIGQQNGPDQSPITGQVCKEAMGSLLWHTFACDRLRMKSESPHGIQDTCVWL